MIQDSRSTKAFETLTGDWAGIHVSDGYALYLHWAGVARQTCLAHLIRKAKKFSESANPEIASGGRWILAELRRLVTMALTPPTNGQFLAWKGRLSGAFKNILIMMVNWGHSQSTCFERRTILPHSLDMMAWIRQITGAKGHYAHMFAAEKQALEQPLCMERKTYRNC